MSEREETRLTRMTNVLPISLAAFFNDMGSDMHNLNMIR